MRRGKKSGHHDILVCKSMCSNSVSGFWFMNPDAACCSVSLLSSKCPCFLSEIVARLKINTALQWHVYTPSFQNSFDLLYFLHLSKVFQRAVCAEKEILFVSDGVSGLDGPNVFFFRKWKDHKVILAATNFPKKENNKTHCTQCAKLQCVTISIGSHTQRP